MKLKISKEKLHNAGRAIPCIVIGTIAGCVTYQLFLFFKIAIFGWNLGLIFAPLVAGYVETYLAFKLLHESTGAISAFILFIVTVVYGFILANPTLGMNFITFGSTIVIIQAALPTLINYILLVVVLGIISYFLGIFKKITDKCYSILRKFYYLKIIKKPVPVKISYKTFVNEHKEFIQINERGFHFLTITEPLYENIEEYFGPSFGSSGFRKKPKIISTDFEKDEKELLKMLKKAKYNALNNLADNIEKMGGNGVVNLKIEYEIIDAPKGIFQVIAHGTAVKIK